MTVPEPNDLSTKGLRLVISHDSMAPLPIFFDTNVHFTGSAIDTIFMNEKDDLTFFTFAGTETCWAHDIAVLNNRITSPVNTVLVISKVLPLYFKYRCYKVQI